MAGRKTKVTVDVGLQFQDAGNSLQKILNNLRTSLTKGEFSNIFGKGFEADLKKYQDALTKVSTFKLTPENTLQYQQAIQELEQSWIRFSKNIETSVASQKLIDPKAIEDAKTKLADLENQLAAATGGLSSKDINAKTGLPKKNPDDTSSYTQEVAKVQSLRQAIAQQHREITILEKAQAQQTAVAQQANAAEKALANSREQHEHVVEGLAEAHRKLAEDEALASRQDTINNIKAKIQQYTSFAFTIQFLRRQWTQLKQTYQEVDEQLTSIAMVSGKSQDSLWAEIGTYNKLAQELGKSTTEVLEASKLFYQQGLSTNEVLTLTTESLKLAAIAETDAKTATDYLTTAINGFKLEASQASMVTDTWAELAGRTAVDVEDLAVGISKVASIAQSAGMELQATSAFLTQIIETTREAPETAGTALKTIIARFQELKTAPGALEDGVDANKVEAALKTAGVALRDASGQFRDFDDVILDLSKKWDGLDRNTQRYIATIAAGSRQQSRFIALVDDYDGLVQNMSYATDSASASMQQFTAYSNGLEASIQRSKTAWEGFYLSLNNGNNIVSFAFNTLTSIFNIMSAIGPGVTLILGGLATGVTKLGVSLLTSQLPAKEWLNTFKLVQAFTNANSLAMQTAIVLTQIHNGELTKEAGITALVTTGKISQANATHLLAKAEAGQTIKTWELVAALMGLNLATLPYVVAITAVVAIIGLLVFALHRANTAEERRIEQLKEEAAAAQEVAQQEQELLKTYEDLADRLDKVATGEENLEDIRKDLIAQLGVFVGETNLLTASYEDLLEVMEKVKREQAGKVATSNYVSAKATFEATEAERIRQIRESDDYKDTKSDFKTQGFEAGTIQKRYFIRPDNGYTSVMTLEEAREAGFEAAWFASTEVSFINGYKTSDGQVFMTIDEAAQHEADLVYGAYTTYGEDLISTEDAELVASTVIAGWDEKEAAERQAILEGLRLGLIDIEQKTEEIDGKTVTTQFISKGSEALLAGIEDIDSAFQDIPENLKDLNLQTQFERLLSGSLDWGELSTEVQEGLKEVAQHNGFIHELILNWENELASSTSKFEGLLEAAGLTLGEKGVNNGPGASPGLASIINSLGEGKFDNLELKNAFLAQWNTLADDPEAQEAYRKAVQALIDANNGDISALTPEMFSVIGSNDEEKISKAYQGLLNAEGELAEGMNEGYYDVLKAKLGDVSAAYYSATKAAEAYNTGLNDIAKAQKGLSRSDMEKWIWDHSESYEKLGFETRQAAIAALWHNTVTEDGNTYKQLESELLSKIADEQGVITQGKIDDAIAELEADNVKLESQKRILEAMKQVALGAKTSAEAQEIIGDNIELAYGDSEDAVNELITDLNPLIEKAGLGQIGTATSAIGAVKDLSKSAIDRFQSVTDTYQFKEIEKAFDDQIAEIENSIQENNQKLNTLYGMRLNRAANKTGSGGKSELERQRELLDKQKEILEAEGDAQEKRIKLIQEELKARKDALKEEQDAIKDAFEQQQEQWKIRLEYVRDTLEAEREALEEAADAAEDAAQKEIDAAKRAAEGKINLIQMQIDAMDEEADAENRLLELQKARDEYERTRTSKTRLVLTKGAGWIFKTDNAQVEDAAANLRDTERDYQKSLLEAQIAEIEKVVESMEDVEGLLGMTADEIAAMNEATKKWSDYLINGTFADEVATQIGTSIVDPETGVTQINPAGVAQAAIDASQAVADWAEKFEPVLEALEEAIDRIGTSMEDMLLNTEAEEKELNDFFNRIVGAGGTNEILSALDGTMVEVEASQREMAEKSAEIDETIKQIEADLDAWDEQLDLIGLSSSEIAETQKQVAEYQAATLEELGQHGKYYEEIVATLKDLAEKWEQYNIAGRNLQAREEAEKGYSSGGVANFRGRAMLHGSTSRPEVVLNNSQAAALFNWVNGLGQERYMSIFDSLDMEVNRLKLQLGSIGAAIAADSQGDTYNFGTINIESDATSLDQLVTDIRRLSPLTNNR